MFKSILKVVRCWALVTWRRWHENRLVNYEAVVLDLDLAIKSEKTLSSRENAWTKRLCRLTWGKDFFN